MPGLKEPLKNVVSSRNCSSKHVFQRFLKAALHCHTREEPFDVTPRHSAKQFIDRANELGFDVVSFTCHEHIFTNTEISQYANEKGILLIPGIEQEIEGKHVLILNADIESECIFDFEDLRKYKKNHDCVVIAPHPYFPFFPCCLQKKLEQHIDLFDAIEWSFFYTQKINCNRKAQKIAQKYNKPLIGTSDIHVIDYFDPTYSYIEAEKNIPSVLEAIRNNKIRIETRPLSKYEIIDVQKKMLINGIYGLFHKKNAQFSQKH